MNPKEFAIPSLKPACLSMLALLLAACAGKPATLERETVVYRCSGDVEMAVIYSGQATGLRGKAELVWEGHSFSLTQQLSGSGTRYGDGTLTLFSKGDDAFVEKAGEMVLKDCLAKGAG
jgi:membrane-bound inhibitor of C-type lysozyme